MSIHDIIKRARDAFDAYCAMDGDQVPLDPISVRQVELARMFPGAPLEVALWGVVRDATTLSTILRMPPGPLEHGRDRESVGLLVRSVISSLMSVCTANRIDFGELCRSESCFTKPGAKMPERGHVTPCEFCHRPAIALLQSAIDAPHVYLCEEHFKAKIAELDRGNNGYHGVLES